MLIADSDILTAAPPRMNLAGVGDLSTVPNAVAEWQLASWLGHGPAYDAAVVEQVLAAMPALPSLAQATRDAEPAGLADLARLLAGSGLSMGIVGSTAPASGNEHAVSHLLEMALAQRQSACRAARHAGDGRDPARAAGLAARRPHDHVRGADPGARGVFAAGMRRSWPSPSSAPRPSRSAGRVTRRSGTGCSRTRPTSRRWSPTGTGSSGR